MPCALYVSFWYGWPWPQFLFWAKMSRIRNFAVFVAWLASDVFQYYGKYVISKYGKYTARFVSILFTIRKYYSTAANKECETFGRLYRKNLKMEFFLYSRGFSYQTHWGHFGRSSLGIPKPYSLELQSIHSQNLSAFWYIEKWDIQIINYLHRSPKYNYKGIDKVKCCVLYLLVCFFKQSFENGAIIVHLRKLCAYQ